MSSQRRYRDAGWLHRQYHNEGLTQKEIGEKCGVSKDCIWRWMDKLDVETGQASFEKDGEWLREKYHDEGWTQYEIAEETGVSVQHVSRLMDQYGIETRKRSFHLDGDPPYTCGCGEVFLKEPAVLAHKKACDQWGEDDE